VRSRRRAWKILDWLASDFVTIPDATAIEAMRLLARGEHDVPIVSGESAAGGMGVLIAAAADPALRTALALDGRSTVVLFGGEGATDPDVYQRLVGTSPDDVFERQALHHENEPAC
jgi:diaminopropionate ammonia-lyase